MKTISLFIIVLGLTYLAVVFLTNITGPAMYILPVGIAILTVIGIFEVKKREY